MLKRIPVSQLRLGMFLHELCGTWMEHPFWRLKFVLQDPDDLRRIAQSGIQQVWIDTARGIDIEGGLSLQEVEAQVERELESALAEPLAPTELPVSAKQEFQHAAQLRDKALRKVQSLFGEARMGQALHIEGCAQTVQDIIASVGRHQGALVSLLRLKSQDEYTYLHSVAVCTLMVALGRTLGLPPDQVHEAGLAGLLHDIGKARISLLVLHKPAKLSDDEFTLIKNHPTWGHELLVRNQTASQIALDVCLHHHEKVNGSGYPKGLKSAEISLFAKMGAVCDVYDAVTSARPYKRAWAPGEAVRQMAQWTDHFDQQVFQAFVKTVGIYPIGTLVRLASGHLGVVCDQTHVSLLKPKVKAFFSIATKERIPPFVVDLAADGQKNAIAGVESADEWDLTHLDRLWLEDVGLKHLSTG